MTAEIRLAALCDHALVGQDGKVSLMGIFRNISVSGLPAQHPRMFVVAILGLEVGAHTVKVRLLRPDGQQAMPNPPEISVHAVAGQDVNVIVLMRFGFASGFMQGILGPSFHLVSNTHMTIGGGY
jgi:hypothetical protein